MAIHPVPLSQAKIDNLLYQFLSETRHDFIQLHFFFTTCSFSNVLFGEFKETNRIIEVQITESNNTI